MLHLSESSPATQPVLLLRLSENADQAAQYRAALAQHGLDLVECTALEAAEDITQGGCRVGLLIVTGDADLAHLDRCEALICNSRVCWVALVAEGLISKPRMREFIAEHLFNFITMPADLGHVVLTLRHAWGMAFMREIRQTPMPADGPDCEYPLVGSSAQMQQLRGQISKIARTDAPVLISGPSGSGKEVAALAIHKQSTRASGPFVAVNCAAVPPQRLQLELFGHGDGDGRLHEARGGTLFLDMVDDLTPDAQAGLLRALSERASTEGTEGTVRKVDVRVMSATRSDLAEAVRQGRFREDLYYRLNVMSLSTQNLAERGQDIEPIARHYFAKFASAHNRSLRGFSKAAMNAMLTHSWPGNVRELINRVQRATVMAEGRFIQPEELGLERPQDQTQLLSLEHARASAERAMIRRALAQSRNQISRAATLLGVSRVTLYRLIEKYNIRPDSGSALRAPFLSMRNADGEVRN